LAGGWFGESYCHLAHWSHLAHKSHHSHHSHWTHYSHSAHCAHSAFEAAEFAEEEAEFPEFSILGGLFGGYFALNDLEIKDIVREYTFRAKRSEKSVIMLYLAPSLNFSQNLA